MEQNPKSNDVVKSDAQASEPTPQELELQKRLGSLSLVVDKLSEQAKLGEALKGDSDFQEFMKLKAAGKKIEFREKNEAPYDPLAELLNLAEAEERKRVPEKGEEEQKGESKTNLADPKELLKVLGIKLPEIIQETLKRSTEPLVAKVAQLERAAQDSKAESEQRNLDKEVAEAASKYTDLAIYQKDIVELSKSIAEKGGLSVEQLYLLSKIGKIGLPDRGTESEYPISVLSTRTSIPVDKVRQGHRGFGDMLNESLKKRFG